MATFNNGESLASVRTKINDAIDKIDGNATISNDLSFGDNDKAIFGAGSDLEVYHDTSSTYGEIASVIADTGAGPLKLVGGTTGRIELVNSDGDVMLQAVGREEVNLYYNNAVKLATTSTGVDITGTLTSDGLTVDGDATISSNSPKLVLEDIDGAAQDDARLQVGASVFNIKRDADNLSRFSVGLSTGDISFYEDTGTTAKLTWDASAESLNFADNGKAIFGAGNDLEIYHDGSNSVIKDNGTGNLLIQGATDIVLEDTSGANYFRGVSGSYVRLYHNNGTKLETTSTGVDITGTLTSDGLTLETNNASINFTGTTGNNFINVKQGLRIDIDNDDDQGATSFGITHGGGTGNIFNASENGDISFYEDTGTTQKLTWSASDEELQLASGVALELNGWTITESGGSLYFATGGTNKMKLDASGNLQVVGNVEANATIS